MAEYQEGCVLVFVSIKKEYCQSNAGDDESLNQM